MIDLLDLHTHMTVNSHAYNSLCETVYSVSAKGLSLFGCSDHAPAIPGNCYSFHSISFKVLSRTLYGVRLMMGVELNIMDYNGTVGLEQSVLEPLDYAIVGLHQPCIHSGTTLQNTNAYLEALKNPLIHTIGHPDDSRFPIDYGTLVAAAGEHHRLPEVNNNSLDPLSFRVGARNNYIKMLKLCKHCSINIIMNSDAHCETDMGNHAFAHTLPEEINFLRELIVNAFLGRLCCFLSKTVAILVQREDEHCGHLYRLITMKEGNAPGRNES